MGSNLCKKLKMIKTLFYYALFFFLCFGEILSKGINENLIP